MSAGIFAFRPEIQAFDEALVKLIAQKSHAITTRIISERNTYRYNHGQTWTHHAEGAGDPGGMHVHSTEMRTPFDEIVRCEDQLILRLVKQVSESFHRQFMQMMYKTVSDTCDKTGNVISQKDFADFPEVFLEMLRTIEFGVDHKGNVSRPELHLGSEAFAKVMPLLEAQPESFKARVAELTAEREREALEREAARLSRFKERA